MWCRVDSIGDPVKIGAGAARLTKNPRDLLIAERTVDLIAASRRFKDGFFPDRGRCHFYRYYQIPG